MAASTVTRDAWTNDTGTAANPNLNGTLLQNSVLQNHIYARTDEMFVGAGLYAIFTLGGLFSVEGFGTISFVAGGSGSHILSVRNTAAGTGNSAIVRVGNDSGANLGQLRGYSSTFTTSGFDIAQSVTLESAGSGGLNLATSHASGPIRIFTGNVGNQRGQITSAGIFSWETFGSHKFAASGTGGMVVTVQNTAPGAANFAGIDFGNDASANAGLIQIFSSTFATAGSSVADGLRIGSLRAGGLTLTATDAIGRIDFRTGSGDTLRVRIAAGGGVIINDLTSPNNVSGLTINQGINADNILTCQYTNFTHGLTSGGAFAVETDTYLALAVANTTFGGARFQATASNSSQTEVLQFYAFGATADTTKGTTGRALTEMIASRHNGANVLTDIAANGNLFGVRGRASGVYATVWNVDIEGDVWQLGRMLLSGGTVGSPVYSFVADADTGMYNVGTNVLGFSVAGLENFRLQGTQVPYAQLTSGAFGTGNITGPILLVGRNSSGNGAAGVLALVGAANGVNTIWADNSGIPGVLRISDNAPPQEDGTPADTSGTVVGAQTSWHEVKNILRRRHDPETALQAVLATPVYDFRYRGTSYLDPDNAPAVFTGLVGFDRHEWFLMNVGSQQIPALNEINAIGYLTLSIQALQGQLDTLKEVVRGTVQ